MDNTIYSLLEPTPFLTILTRLESIEATHLRQWGKMDIAQMLAHCAIPLEQVTGKMPFVERNNWFFRTVIKRFVVNKRPFKPNSPTVPEFVVADARVFEIEKARLIKALHAFYAMGQHGVLPRHPSFGILTKDEWGILQYKHLIHHLAQFSA